MTNTASADVSLTVGAAGVSSTTSQAATSSAAAPLLYCIVMERGDRNLQAVIASENIAGMDPEAIRNIASQLALGIEALHASGAVHGDLTPLNCVRVGERWKVSTNNDHASCSKFSLSLCLCSTQLILNM